MESRSKCSNLCFGACWAPPKGIPVTPHYLSLDIALDTPLMANGDSILYCQRCPKRLLCSCSTQDLCALTGEMTDVATLKVFPWEQRDSGEKHYSRSTSGGNQSLPSGPSRSHVGVYCKDALLWPLLSSIL